MRIALVSPYSWSYPGGVTRHVSGLADALRVAGHEVTVMAPLDPVGPVAVLTHLGASPSPERAPEHLRSLGRTAGIRINGALSALSVSPLGLYRLARELRHDRYDVVHVHEPDAPPVGWVALLAARAPLVGTFHTYNEHRLSHAVGAAAGVRLVLNHLDVRLAVSEAAAWTGRRFFGGCYLVIPNGVDLRAARAGGTPPRDDDRLRVVFVGQPVARKGLPVLLRAFEMLRQSVPAELVLVGPDRGDVQSLLRDQTDVHALGKVDDRRKFEELRAADVLCAPSLGNESFGMVLTEAFAAGIPVVASDIPGYREVVQPGVDGLLVTPGDPRAWADALKKLSANPDTRAAMALEAARSAKRFDWPVVAEEVLGAYRQAMEVPLPQGRWNRARARLGLLTADRTPRGPERRPPSFGDARAASLRDGEGLRRDGEPRRRGREGSHLVRRLVTFGLWVVVAVLAGIAIDKMGLHNVTTALGRANVPAAIGVVALMCAAMPLRGVSWRASLEAALPDEHIRTTDAIRGVLIGVLVSSTLPANLGEPSRAMVVARKTSRPWGTLAVVAGTMVSLTLINAFALVVLGVVTFTTSGLFGHYKTAVELGFVSAIVLIAALLSSPLLLRGAKEESWLAKLRDILHQVRSGLVVFRNGRLGTIAVVSLLAGWAVQWSAVYLLLAGLHLTNRAGLAAAAAILFAINITMVLPFTPGDIGVFQAATAFVLNSGWGVPYSRGVAYGIVLQAAELATALIMGVPALLREGMSWRAIARRGLTAVEEEEMGEAPLR